MAEFLTFATQELLTKVSSLAAQEFTLVWGFKEDLTKLRRSLNTLQAVLRDAEHPRQDPGESLKLWLEELEDIAHLADQVFDDYGYELVRRKVELRNQIKKKVLNFFSLSNPIVFRVKMAHKIKKINTSLDELKKDASTIGLVAKPSSESTISHDRRIGRETYSDFKKDESNIIGRKNVAEDIVKALTNQSNNQGNNLSVLAIVGMGGLGKTTLAKSVYHDGKIQQHFQKKIWVCVSTPFEVDSILRGILESLKPEHAAVQAIDAICRILKEELKGKRYILVLDDVWNEDEQKWEELIGCLENVNDTQGSSILVTTRNGKVAKIVETLPSHDLQKLSDDECWQILNDRANPVGSAPVDEDQLKIGREIAKKCGGVPLVAKVLGNMMRYKNCDGWRSIADSVIWDLPNGENRILEILKLSFDELGSPSLKQCFAYCSMFIKDFEFKKDDLVQHWMAQGWLHPSPNQNDREMEDIGNEYFHILLQNSFFQDVRTNYFGNVSTYKMHDLVHDLAIRVFKSKYSRSLFFNGAVLESNSPGFKTLHVLNLYKADIEELPHSIGKLKYLRYLNVMETRISAFPKSLWQLYNLQTLKMTSDYDPLTRRFKELPVEIANLTNLRHIDFGRSVKVPAGVFGRLTNLRSLPFVKISKETGPQIGELGGLNHLRDALSIYGLEHVGDGEEAEKAKLVEKKHVRKLVLYWERSRPSNSGDTDKDVLEFLRPHSNLKYLEIDGFMGVKFPSWLSLCNNLQEIELQRCSNCEEVPALGRLPNLVRVKLFGMENLRCLGYEFYGYDPVCDDGKVLFPALKTLCIGQARNLVEWREVPKERVEVFPCLEELTLWSCGQLTSAPSHFPCLKKLKIKGMNSGGIPIASILSNSLTTLTSLEIWYVSGLACLPERLLENNLNLVALEISDCSELTCIAPPQSHRCASLRRLRITECPKLSCLPDCGLSIQILEIERCKILESILIIPEQDCLPSLQRFKIRECSELSSLPDGLQFCTSLRHLEIQSCPKIKSIPIPSAGLPSLQQLEINKCPQICSLPDGIQYCSSLQRFEIRECPELSSLPDGLQFCTSLQQLEIQSCPKIKSIPIPSEGLPSLARLELRQCDELSSLPSGLGCCTSLAKLTITRCPNLTSIPSARLSTTLQELTVSNESLPNLHGGFKSLRRLEIWKCQSTEIDLPVLASLQVLTIIDFPNLERISSLHKLTSLRELSIWDCSRLTFLPSGLAMASPHVLWIYGWPEIKSLPEQIQHLTSLTFLSICDFEGVEAIPEWLGNLASLESLFIYSCQNLMYLPSVQAMHRLTKLEYLGIYRCPLLSDRCKEETGPEWPKISHIPDIIFS